MTVLSLNNRISHNTILKLGAEMIGRAATFLLLLGAARLLSPADFGLYNYGLALGFVLAQLADFGLQLLITRQVARDAGDARAQIVAAFHLKLWLSLPVFLLLWMATLNQPAELRLSLLLIGLTLWLQTFLEFLAYVFRGQQRLGEEVLLLTGVRLLTAVGGALVLWQSGRLLGLVGAGLLLMLFMTGVGLHRLRRAGWIEQYRQLLPHRWPWELRYQELWRQTWPLGLSIFLSIAYTRLAVLLLQQRAGATAVAHYSAAYRLVEPMQILPASLLAAVFPAFTLALTRDQGRARRLGWQTSLLLAGAGASLALGLSLSANWLVPWLYGDPFAPAVPALQILSLALIPMFINYSLTHYLIARNQQAHLSGLTAVTLGLHAFLCWQLIPRLDIVGPALSLILVEAALTVGCLIFLSRPAPGETAV